MSLAKKEWVTAEGRIIPVTEMDTNHIKNCIIAMQGLPAWLEMEKVNGESTQEWLKVLKDELLKRPIEYDKDPSRIY